jgi:hypothetical protein
MDRLKIEEEALARLSLRVYRQELGDKDADSQVAKDGDNGEKQARRAMAYGPLMRSMIEAILREGGTVPGASLVDPPKPQGKKGKKK